MRKLIPVKLLVCVMAVTAALSSCRTYDDNDIKPDSTGTGTGTGDGASNQNQVIIAFPKTSLDINTTDSVVAVLTSGNTTIRKKATKGGTFYTLSLNGVSTGTWAANIKVYTAASATLAAKMYRYETQLNTAVSTSLVGPTGKLTDTWKTNLFMYNSTYGISFAVAALPSDPYYELFLPPTVIGYSHVYFERYVYKTVDSVDYVVQYGNLSFKAADYKGFQSNVTAFAPFPNAMKNQPWDTADVSLQLYNQGSSTADYKILFQQTVANK